MILTYNEKLKRQFYEGYVYITLSTRFTEESGLYDMAGFSHQQKVESTEEEHILMLRTLLKQLMVECIERDHPELQGPFELVLIQ